MWNLLSLPSQWAFYKPTASTGTITSAGNAYDVDAYPWATKATRLLTGSATPGTPDTDIVIFHTFPTLAKANIGTLSVTSVIDVQNTPDYLVDASGYIITATLEYEYSMDGGSTWSQIYWSVSYYRVADMVFLCNPPASDISVANLASADGTSGLKLGISKNLDPSLLTTGLQDLQVRFKVQTLTSVRAGNPQSSLSYGVWDIVALVG